MNNYLNPMIFGNETEMVPTRNGYGEGLLELGEKNTKVVVLTGDLAESTRVLEFAKKYPQRFIECGVAEQNMTGIAAGLAAARKNPVVSAFSAFFSPPPPANTRAPPPAAIFFHIPPGIILIISSCLRASNDIPPIIYIF